MPQKFLHLSSALRRCPKVARLNSRPESRQISPELQFMGALRRIERLTAGLTSKVQGLPLPYIWTSPMSEYQVVRPWVGARLALATEAVSTIMQSGSSSDLIMTETMLTRQKRVDLHRHTGNLRNTQFFLAARTTSSLQPCWFLAKRCSKGKAEPSHLHSSSRFSGYKKTEQERSGPVSSVQRVLMTYYRHRLLSIQTIRSLSRTPMHRALSRSLGAKSPARIIPWIVDLESPVLSMTSPIRRTRS